MLVSANACISLCLLNFGYSCGLILSGYGAFFMPHVGLISCANGHSTILLWTKTCPFKMAQ